MGSFEDIMAYLSAYVGHEKADGANSYFKHSADLFAADNGLVDAFIQDLLPEV